MPDKFLNKTYLLLSLATGVILALGWPPLPLGFLLFIGFVPLLIMEERISQSNRINATGQLFRYSYLAFLVWNSLSTWWIWNASAGGAIMAIVLNSLLMCLPIIFFHLTKKYAGKKAGYISLIIYWLAFEYIHLQWELTWPWLNLGNGLAGNINWVQWYEFTGTAGGSLWILLVNMAVFLAINYAKNAENKRGFYLSFLWPSLFFALPILISSFIGIDFRTVIPKKSHINVVVVQPNIDPYEKFERGTSARQLNTLISMSEKNINQNTDYVVWPETSVPQNIWLNEFEDHEPVKRIREFLKTHPQITLVTGISAFRFYKKNEDIPITAKKLDEGHYDAFNSAVQLDSGTSYKIYHKSKLVPGVERIPYPAFFKFLETYSIDLGGYAGNYGTQEIRSVFFNRDSIGIGPIICYESIFPEFVAGYVKNGAQALFIITNDGWWGNTPGYKQHLRYASLRAIETRRCIARSANTGSSCFINEKGEIQQATKYWEPAVIKQSLTLSNELTFFSKYGDIIGRVAAYSSLLFILITLILSFKKRQHYEL